MYIYSLTDTNTEQGTYGPHVKCQDKKRKAAQRKMNGIKFKAKNPILYVLSNFEFMFTLLIYLKLVLWLLRKKRLLAKFWEFAIRLFFSQLEISHVKSDNLQYNTLARWVDGTNDSSTKRLMFQAFFFFS